MKKTRPVKKTAKPTRPVKPKPKPTPKPIRRSVPKTVTLAAKVTALAVAPGGGQAAHHSLHAGEQTPPC